MRVLAFASATLLAACSPAKRVPPAAERTDTVRSDTMVATPSPAVTQRREAPQQTAAALVFLGTWDFAPPAGLHGPHLSITVDSAHGNEIFGRITRALSGDMETSSMFEPFRGQVDAQ